METCARQYWYRSLRIVPKEKAKNMMLGNIRHSGFEHTIRTNTPAVCDDPRLTEQETKSINAEFSAFYNWWLESDLIPLSFKDGMLAVELNIEAEHPDDPSVILNTKLDLAAVDSHDMVYLLDWKSGKTNTSQTFVDHSDQLSFMEVVLEPYLKGLGIKQVDRLGIVESKAPTKKRKEAKVIGPIWSYRRSPQQINDLLSKALAIADRIRRQEFFMTSRYAFNSPCNMCDYAKLCQSAKAAQSYNNRDGVEIPIGIMD
ncbi:PD-(D/E)XK nuclease family protein [Acidithiobacillus ferrianus]|uniref:PD-(D/E)XK nuclease family protein n=1 Tax=Acidithiobacillus ferrianus TaxID=2678518 RepID=UPI0034E503B3